ncbi:MAG: hypothetical protein OER88_11435, partial [Planctomycetota bacterium]|nr:hypothetical protein [Planctomycetota bacterium]
MSTRVVLLVAALLACGCTTPQERYEDASKDESQGRWAAAAEKYIAVLREDPEYPEARARAKSAGDRAIAGWVEAASGLEEVERYDRALAEYQRTDRLLDKAAVVGVVLDPPADYADRRRGVNRKAAESALAAADRIAAEGNWNTASNAYLRVESRYELTSEQKQRAKSGRFEALLTGARVAVEAGKFDQADSLVTAALSVYGKSSPHSADALLMNTRIQQGRYDALVESARSEADAGHYQRAYGVVEKALAIFGAAANESASARELQERIVLEGTVQVAVTPVWKHETVVRHVPDGILPDLNGVLEDQHWAGAPMFTEVIDPRSVRRTLRRLHLARDVISDPQAGLVAQQLGADFTLVLYLVRCDHDANETPVSHAVPTSKGDPD